MNSEELELSLRAEFESYLKNVFAEMRQETTEFQSKLQTQLDEAFQAFAGRFESEQQFDEAFRGSVAEHLRLARDEGARITADAMAEAEKLDREAAPVAASYDIIRDAVNEISGKDSQSAILKSLVLHAADFAPRGAFFIIRNEHFVGWRVFGADSEAAENAIRDITFPTLADSILGAATRSLSTVDGHDGLHSDDSAFLAPLQFGHPDRMYAVPLMARGRGVAVLYADYGSDGTSLNREALETLVRVAGLSVELLAATQTAKADNRPAAAADFESTQSESYEAEAVETEAAGDDTVPEMLSEDEHKSDEFQFSDTVSFPAGFPLEPEAEASFEAESEAEPEFTPDQETAESQVEPEFAGTEETDEFSYTEEPSFTVEHASLEPVESDDESVIDADIASDEADFESGGSIEPAAFEASPIEQAPEDYEPAVAVNGFNQVVEPVIDATPQSGSKSRLSDRPVDLPIEVPEEERRVHIDARRFARLLVSEIKLYNEKKVIEGRESRDLYDRLRDAIDRSREMYDKRVQPPVAAKFDYFHYELVNSLAEGEQERLGASYPGAAL